MNKYQESLNDIKKAFAYSIQGKVNVYGEDVMVEKVSRCMAQSQIDTLQELIDIYSKFNEDKSCQYLCDTKALLEEQLSIVKERLSIIEKALDKACWLIATNGDCDFFDCPFRKRCKEYHDVKCNDLKTWKEYLLKESEKQ